MVAFEQVKTPPQDLESEKAVLSSIIMESDKLIEVQEFVTAEDFYKPAHQVLFRAMEKLASRQEAIDALTIRALLDSQGELESIGGIDYLAEVISSQGTAANAIYYAKIVAEKALLRGLISRLTANIEQAYAQDTPAEDLVAAAEKNLIDLSQGQNKSGFRSMRDIVDGSIEHIELMSTQKSQVTGVSTGYKGLDAKTTGLHEEELIILAARPSVGKTAFALNLAQNIGIREGKTVAIFSLEMGAESLVNRMLSSVGRVEAEHLRTGQLTDEEWDNLVLAASSLADTDIYIDDTPGIKITEIRAKTRKLAQEKGNLGLVLIDYLQLITGNGKESRQQEVSDISRQLKILAKELKVPVIALSQLSRGVEQRQDKHPMLSDLRESGSIEQDADIVMFLYRDDYHRSEDEEDDLPQLPSNDSTVEVILAKNRSGSLGTVELMFTKNYQKFTSIDYNND